ncbi:MAG: hypothetical protein WDN09_03690 [bacterium]
MDTIKKNTIIVSASVLLALGALSLAFPNSALAQNAGTVNIQYYGNSTPSNGMNNGGTSNQNYYGTNGSNGTNGADGSNGTNGANAYGSVNGAAPVVYKITPGAIAMGSSKISLNVIGANFVPASIVRYNGADRTTTFVSGTQLSVTLNDADMAAIGSYPITVFTPSPGGISNVTTFNVTNGTPVIGNADVITNPDGTIAASNADGSGTTTTATNTTNTSTTTVKNQPANASSGFFPWGFLAWLFLAIVILLGVILWRKYYLQKKEEEEKKEGEEVADPHAHAEHSEHE